MSGRNTARNEETQANQGGQGIRERGAEGLEEERLGFEEAWGNAGPGDFVGGERRAEDEGVGAVEVETGGIFEVGGRGVEDNEIEGRMEEGEEGVALDDGVGGLGEGVAEEREGCGELSLAGTQPEGTRGAGNEEARGVGAIAAVALFVERKRMFVRGAAARLTVEGADAVSVLSDFDGGPGGVGEGAEEIDDKGGLADVAGVAADEEEGQGQNP